MTYFLGIDASTTATKALLIDGDGSIVGVGRSEYSFDTPHPLWSEQSPDLWWAGTIEAIRSVLSTTGVSGHAIAGVGMTGQMHGLVMLDASGTVLRPAILWNDQRTQLECDEIRDRVGRDRLVSITGNDALTGFTAPKILWVKNNEPEVFERTEHVLLPKDYVRFCLTDAYAADRAGGSGTILFDLANRDWSDEVIATLGLPRRWFPPSFEGPSVTGVVTAAAAAATGLAEGTPVVAGGGDQAANGVGVGAVTPGVGAMSIGTSGVVFVPTDHAAIESEGRLHAFCHAVPEMWHLMGVMLSAAGSYEWFRSALAPSSSFADLDARASAVDAGSNGLMFLPYLSGERTPHPDPLARGAFVGLTVRHDLGHMARAVLEGVAFGLRDSFELVRQSSILDEIRASGGGAQSRVWLQIIADTVGLPVRVVGTSEAAAHGAALLAAVGTGAFASIREATDAAVVVGEPIEPGPATGTYAEAYDTYRSLYPALRESFVRLSGLDA
ncbi:MAG TPA: xylulokinase [Acidimicrobiia bacterium]|nr:xylulokinase [Acidimicrobiia bacterium]